MKKVNLEPSKSRLLADGRGASLKKWFFFHGDLREETTKPNQTREENSDLRHILVEQKNSIFAFLFSSNNIITFYTYLVIRIWETVRIFATVFFYYRNRKLACRWLRPGVLPTLVTSTKNCLDLKTRLSLPMPTAIRQLLCFWTFPKVGHLLNWKRNSGLLPFSNKVKVA